MRDVWVEDLCVGCGPRSVLGPLSFEVKPNTTMAIVGPGGSGKSTLLKALAGRLPPDMWVRGGLSVASRAIGFLMQKSPAPEGEANGGNDFAPSTRRMVDPTLRIADFRSVMATDARIILLDEPEARLPASYYDQIEIELNRIRGQRTVILVTHNLMLVERVSDSMMLLIDGEIIEQGETARLFSSPAKKRTSHFIRMGS